MSKTAMQELIDELYKRRSDEAWAYMSQVWPRFIEKEKQQHADTAIRISEYILGKLEKNDGKFDIEKAFNDYYTQTYGQ